MSEYYWDDQAFEARVRSAAEARGEDVETILLRANVSRMLFSREIFNPSPEKGRPAGIIWRIAEAAGLTPQELFEIGVRRRGG